MTKPPHKVQGNKSELYPNAWERFEHAVDVVIKSGPKRRQAPPSIDLGSNPPRGLIADLERHTRAARLFYHTPPGASVK